MGLRICWCILLLLLVPCFGDNDCQTQNGALLTMLQAEVEFLAKGIQEMSSYTKDIVWNTMRMEMRVNQLQKEIIAYQQKSAASAVQWSQLHVSSSMSGAASTTTGTTSAGGSTAGTSSCTLRQVLLDQLKDNASIEIKINSGMASPGPGKQTPGDQAIVSAAQISSCSEASKTGIYKLKLVGNTTADVLCDAEYDKGGWVVIQYRFNGSEEFYRNWTDYQNGFGSLSGEFWLGNEIIYQLTVEKPREIAFLMEDFDGAKGVARYATFKLGDKTEKYPLKSLGTFSGGAGDSLSRNVGSKFSTHDMDNDKSGSHCAQLYAGGWWYDDCHLSNLNGQYMKGTTTVYAKSMCWSSFKGFYYSLKSSRIMVRF
ncbi:fibrinogen and fibronectin [Anopheles darlingi]|uniref:Fibrinogen and fibronectin n=1 Tax=Anopheles darlingi TaxID=43151 RepID=W5JQJ4_ANODA|nr:fibrinogen and fibronectin [Anopheles darlingi]